MILLHSRFAGLLAVYIAGTVAASPGAFAQAYHRRASLAAESALDATLNSPALRSTLSGVVRDGNGRPQIGALVELLNAQYGLVARTFTDDRGHYALPRLGQGVYQVKATNPYFLPTILPNLRVLADSKVIVNLTLSTLYQALTWLPAQPRRPDSGSDDWNWTLRLSANRPLLRALDEQSARLAAANGSADLSGPVLVQSESATPPEERSRRAAMRTGLTRFGQGGLREQAQWSANDGGTRALLFGAEGSTSAAGAEAISSTGAYRQQLAPDRSVFTVVTVTDRPRIHAGSGAAGSGAADGLAMARVRSGTSVQLGEAAELSAGTELAYARLASGASTAGSHPYAAITVHAGPTTISYRLATARSMSEDDRVEAEAAEDAPLLSEIHGALTMEQGLHQELRATRELADGASVWTGEVSAFADTLEHPAVEGAVRGPVKGDEAAIDSNNVLFDPGTGTIAVSGPGYHGAGIMAVLRDQLSPGTWLSFRYALGKAIALPEGDHEPGGVAQSFAARPASMLAFTAETHVPTTGTVLRGSYRWQPASTLTQVAPFREDAPDAYLALRVRQPLHLKQAGAGRLEAVLDVRNLLAQGYRPFLSQDGSTVYFAQAQRCIAGGIGFSF